MRHRLLSVAVPVRGAVRWPQWLLVGARGGIAAGLVAALGAAGLPVMAASAAGRAGGDASDGGTPRPVASVPMVTGGQVVVTAAGGQSLFLLPGAAGRGAAVGYQDEAGDRFIVPTAAMPYLGRELGSSLFDVSALARDRITGRARIPVRLRFGKNANRNVHHQDDHAEADGPGPTVQGGPDRPPRRPCGLMPAQASRGTSAMPSAEHGR
jgi:hypothetical protein